MPMQTLGRAHAFGAGADLWVIPSEAETSTLLKKIDWYLNFQISRAQAHRPEEISPQLRVVLNENSLPSFDNPTDKSAPQKMPLMISSSRNFPTQKIIAVAKANNSAAWAEEIHEIWMGLDRPPLRVFLPQNMTATEFTKVWPGSKSEDLTLVPT